MREGEGVTQKTSFTFIPGLLPDGRVAVARGALLSQEGRTRTGREQAMEGRSAAPLRSD